MQVRQGGGIKSDIAPSSLKIDFQRVDERQEPGQELLVYRMGAVGFEAHAVVELHHAAELVTLRPRGDIFADPGFDQAGDASLEVADCGDDLLLLIGGDAGLPTEGESVDDHGGYSKGFPFRERPDPHPLPLFSL